jgi:hypothetical protein
MPAYSFLDDWLQADGTGIIFVVEPKTNRPARATPLALAKQGLPQPEILSVRELLAVGNPFAGLPVLSR